MATFIVTTVNPDPRVEAALQREYPGSTYRFSDRVHFLSAAGTAQEVALRLGVKFRDPNVLFDGLTDIVVNKLAPSYYGFYGTDLWDWLQKSLERD